MVVTARNAASVSNAGRQPCCSISHASIGKKIVLASPAISVTTIMARVRFRSNQAVMTTKAGS